MTCSYRWLTHVCTYTHRWAPKTARLGNGEFPKPQSAWEGEGSHGKAECLHAVPLSEQTGPELKQTERGKEESRIIDILIWQERVTTSDGSKTHECDLSTHCGRSAGRPVWHTHRAREVDDSSAPSLTQFGKTQIRGQSRCQSLQGLGTPMAPPNRGAWRAMGLGDRQVKGVHGRRDWWKFIWKFLLITVAKLKWKRCGWMSRKCLESFSRLAQLNDVCETLQRLRITSKCLTCGHSDYCTKPLLWEIVSPIKSL